MRNTRNLGIILSTLAALVLAGCGGAASQSSVINGNWTAALTSSASGTPVFSFTTTLTDMGNGGVSVTNLTFTTATPCFSSSTSATGGFTLSGTTNGVTSGGFQMTVQSGPAGTPGNNILTLQGTLSNNTVTGTWTLTGIAGGCTGSGTFTMNKM